MDERFGNIGYQTGHYEGTDFVPPIILNGRIYYNIMSLPREGYQVLDLYTGEELWFMNSSGPVTGTGGGFDFSGELPYGRLSFGQIYDYHSPNQHGGLPYLWSTSGPDGTWMMYDAETGNYICSINNIPMGMGFFGPAPAGTAVYGKDGSLLRYIIAGTPNPMGPFFPDVAPFYLQVWNTSRAIWYEESWSANEYWMWRPTLNMTFDGNNGYSLNVSMPDVQGSIRAVRDGEYVIGGTSGKNNGTYVEDGQLWALSLEKGKEGTLLWEITFTPPEAPPDVATGLFGGMSGPNVVPEDGIFHFSEPITRRRWGYDLETGQQIWGPTEPETALHYYALMTNVYEGKLFSGGYGGVLTAYNITTGEVLWEFAAQQVGFESPYGNYPIGISCIADGKLYLTSSEHSPTQPLWRGSYLRCINASDGEELWKIAYMSAGDGGAHLTAMCTVIADGY
ncbi:MAG: PQQ-binding-like beta-propeller repeat protein, partial [Desulfobacterales bacterium]|nr:PQQ-binding-like beta-propeller repeat protein [Desulfobacterales bacterium]